MNVPHADAGETRQDLCAIFDHACRAHPEKIALEIPPNAGRARVRLRYSELQAWARAIAALLPSTGAPDRVIALALARTDPRLFASMLGAMQAGFAYAAIDPTFPAAQAAAIVRDADACAIIADPARARAILAAMGHDPARDGGAARAVESAHQARAAPPRCITPAEIDGAVTRGADARVLAIDPASLAYVIYTSGTTGRPKGVEIEHRAIANLVQGDRREFGLHADDRVVQGSSASYDSSIEELWLAWSVGATALVMDDEAARLGPDLLPWLVSERATVLCPPPTLLRTLGCNDPESALPGLRLLYVGGEALAPDLASLWGRGRRLENGYGPTECAVTCLRGRVEPDAPVTIGRPIPGTRAWVVDDSLAPVADGTQGELVIGGASLARGYRGDPSGTAVRFVSHPSLGRIYRTGDLVHRDGHGDFHYHGRIDAQVKLRGYRIELSAVEAVLAAHPQVLEAACTVEEGTQRRLVAHAVARPGAVLDAQAIRDWIAEQLPMYMVPVAIAEIAALPRSVGGKLDRARLPAIASSMRTQTQSSARAPESAQDQACALDPTEQLVASAVAQALGVQHSIGADEDFFDDLGMDSLTMAMMVSALRRTPQTARATVRLSYEHRSVRATARALEAAMLPSSDASRAAAQAAPASEAVAPASQPTGNSHPLGATMVQATLLLIMLVVGAQLAWLPALADLIASLDELAAPVWAIAAASAAIVGICAYLVASVLLTIAVKWVLIGRYRTGRTRAWSSWHVRHWATVRCAALIPWRTVQLAGLAPLTLRMLGARVGRGVHVHGGARMAGGGWDLLTLSDGATVGQDALLQCIRLEAGCFIAAPLTVGQNATVQTRAGLAPGATLARGSILRALSYLSPGTTEPDSVYDGVPARRVGSATLPIAPVHRLSESVFVALSALLLATTSAIALAAWPVALLLWGFHARVEASGASGDAIGATMPTLAMCARFIGAVVTGTALASVVRALLIRALGRAPSGPYALHSFANARMSLQASIVEEAGRLLSGSLLWPLWLRAAGARIGAGCEISTITDVVPSQIRLGRETFFADGIYIGGPLLQAGQAVIKPVILDDGCFVGNHAVLPGATRLAPGTLIGISTRGDALPQEPNSSWFGHPPIRLPRRQVLQSDRDVTHEPNLLRFINRWCWELARFLLPALPLGLAFGWWMMMERAQDRLSPTAFRLLALPLGVLALWSALVLAVLALKWLLLGRVRPGIHPLWSCWCSRWDFVYVAWGMWAAVPLAPLEGTLLLNFFLRAVGCNIGERVLLGPGFTHVVDPDMLHFDDGATVEALFQAHTFEDRILKIDHIRIGAGASIGANAVLLYGCQIGEGATVHPHSVVMKHEHLLPWGDYAGAPTQPTDESAPAALTASAR